MTGWAQTAGVTGPVTGYIFDAPSGALRAMLGIPGAAYLSGVRAAGLAAAVVAPDGSAAIGVEQRTGKLVVYIGLGSPAPRALTVSGAIAGADRFAWTADSSGAAVYSPANGQAQIITGAATAPVGGTPIDLTSLPGPVTAMAFDGKLLIVGVSGGSGGVFLVSASSGPRRVAPAASPSAIAVAGSSLYFADNQSQQIWQVQSYATAPTAMLFANDSAVNEPAGLQVSADGQRLLVANAGNRKLAVYEIASRLGIQTVDLAFTPTCLDRFGDASVFVMNGSGPGPLYVVDDRGPAKAAVFFVPAPVQPRRQPVRP